MGPVGAAPTTPPWSRSSTCCERTSSTADGPPARSYAPRSCSGSNAPITATPPASPRSTNPDRLRDTHQSRSSSLTAPTRTSQPKVWAVPAGRDGLEGCSRRAGTAVRRSSHRRASSGAPLVCRSSIGWVIRSCLCSMSLSRSTTFASGAQYSSAEATTPRYVTLPNAYGISATNTHGPSGAESETSAREALADCHKRSRKSSHTVSIDRWSISPLAP